MYFVGCAGIYLMTAISIERYKQFQTELNSGRNIQFYINYLLSFISKFNKFPNVKFDEKNKNILLRPWTLLLKKFYKSSNFIKAHEEVIDKYLYWIYKTDIWLFRYLVVYKPINLSILRFKYKLLTIFVCLMLGLLWAVLPLFGWSHYTLESGLTSCTVEWSERTLNVVSYNVTIWLAGFIAPLIIILYTNYKLIVIVRISIIKSCKLGCLIYNFYKFVLI